MSKSFVEWVGENFSVKICVTWFMRVGTDSAWILHDITKIAKSDLIGLFLEFSAEGMATSAIEYLGKSQSPK